MDDINKFFLDKSNRKLSANTIDRYRRALCLLTAEIPNLSAADPEQISAWLDAHPWGSSSRWVAWVAAKRYITWLYGAAHPALGFAITRTDAPPQRFLKLDQVRCLLASFDTATPIGKRDLAICGIFLDAGLRVSEVCRLELRYLDLDAARLNVIVKRGKWNVRGYSPHTANWLSAWLAVRPAVAAPTCARVFCACGGLTPGHELTRDGLKVIVRAWGKRTGIGPLSPHDFRRTFASLATQSGAPEDVVMKAGGWASHDVLRRYTVGVDASHIAPWYPIKTAMS